jgi:hypothetical protein
MALRFSREKLDVTTLCIIGRRLLSLKVMFLNFNFGKHGDKNIHNITRIWNLSHPYITTKAEETYR